MSRDRYPFSAAEDDQINRMAVAGRTAPEIAAALERAPETIRRRAARLGVELRHGTGGTRARSGRLSEWGRYRLDAINARIYQAWGRWIVCPCCKAALPVPAAAPAGYVTPHRRRDLVGVDRWSAPACPGATQPPRSGTNTTNP